ncbi:MAG: rhomboid family intramembrane serine protease [Elusimicrobiota bacterium]
MAPRNFSHAPIDFNTMSPVIKALVIANAVAFLMSQLVAGQFSGLFGLVPARVVEDRWIWQLFPYLFLHGSFLHLIFNLFALWMFGMPVEAQWGPREFLKFFLICGVGAGLINVALTPHSHYPVIGASGAVYGLLVAFAMLYPDAVVYLYFFFPIKAKHMAMLFGLLEFFAASDGSSGVARYAHLGGMVIGYLYIRWWWILSMRVKALWRDMTQGGVVVSERPRAGARSSRKTRPVSYEEEMAEVDRILDKILDQGEASLTEQEREVLRKHGPGRPGEGGHA